MSTVRARMRADLTTAIKSRDRVSITALRSALAAIDNAEAVAVDRSAPTTSLSEHVAGAAGPSEVARRDLTEAEIIGLVVAELDERDIAATEYENAGRLDRAATIRAEADALRGYVTPHAPS